MKNIENSTQNAVQFEMQLMNDFSQEPDVLPFLSFSQKLQLPVLPIWKLFDPRIPLCGSIYLLCLPAQYMRD